MIQVGRLQVAAAAPWRSCRKSSSRSCSRWHSRCTTSIRLAARRWAGVCGFGQILGQQLHVEPNRRERILDLVRQPAGQPRDLRVLVEQPLDGLRTIRHRELGSAIRSA